MASLLYIVAWGKTSASAGRKAATGADAWAVFPNLTPELTEQWVVPYAERLFKRCTDFGLITMAAGGGGDYCEERIEKFDKQILHRCFAIQQKRLLNTPMLILGMGRWHEYPLEPVAEYLKKYQDKGICASIMANLNARLLRDGPPERIVEAVKRFIKVLGKAHNLAIVLANIPADTPPRHIHAALRKYLNIETADPRCNLKVPATEMFDFFNPAVSSGYVTM